MTIELHDALIAADLGDRYSRLMLADAYEETGDDITAGWLRDFRLFLTIEEAINAFLYPEPLLVPDLDRHEQAVLFAWANGEKRLAWALALEARGLTEHAAVQRALASKELYGPLPEADQEAIADTFASWAGLDWIDRLDVKVEEFLDSELLVPCFVATPPDVQGDETDKVYVSSQSQGNLELLPLKRKAGLNRYPKAVPLYPSQD